MKKTIFIEGMSCGHCASHVKEALSEIAGVTSVNVSLESKSAVIEGAVGVTNEIIKAAIDEVGFEVVGIDE